MVEVIERPEQVLEHGDRKRLAAEQRLFNNPWQAGQRNGPPDSEYVATYKSLKRQVRDDSPLKIFPPLLVYVCRRIASKLVRERRPLTERGDERLLDLAVIRSEGLPGRQGHVSLMLKLPNEGARDRSRVMRQTRGERSVAVVVIRVGRCW